MLKFLPPRFQNVNLFGNGTIEEELINEALLEYGESLIQYDG